jgi:hypothetical protein
MKVDHLREQGKGYSDFDTNDIKPVVEASKDG